MSASIKDLAEKLERLESDQRKGGRSSKSARRGGGGDQTGLDSTKFGLIEKESSKIALELNHGMLVEALKEFMFTNEQKKQIESE